MNPRFPFEQFPLFAHFSQQDRSAVIAVSKLHSCASGDVIDLRSSRQVHFVVSGFFRSEGPVHREESVFFGPGTVLGSLPFSDLPSRGAVKAVVASAAFTVEIDALYHILMGSYRTARGFIRMLSKAGLEPSQSVRGVSDRRTRVVAVTGTKGAGKTLSSIFLADALSKQGPTVLIDLSSAGRSLFDYLQMKITPPLSQKKAGQLSDSLIHERISRTSSGFDLMNIASGSHVAIDPGILPPVLFCLSQTYSYVVIDCGGIDHPMTAKAAECSDFVCAVAKKKNDAGAIREFCDRVLTDGQELFFCDNRFFAKTPVADSLLTLAPIPADSEEGILFEMSEIAEGSRGAVEKISAVRELYVLSGAGFHSYNYAGLFDCIPDDGRSLVAAGSLPFICAALFLSSGRGKNGEKEVASFFREENIRAITAPVFPDRWLLGSASVRASLDSIGQSLRLEHMTTPLVAHIGRAGDADRFATTGSLRTLSAASFCESPLFEPVKCGKELLTAPSSPSTAARILTLSADRLTCCSVRTQQEGYQSVLPLVRGVFTGEKRQGSCEWQKWVADRNIVIDANPASPPIKKALALSRQMWENAFSEMQKD